MNHHESLGALPAGAPERADAANQGVLLVGHGTREAVGIEEFLTLAAMIATRLASVVVAPAFLEFAQPTIREGIELLAQRNIRRITIMPLLLFAAGHAKRDIPREVAAAAKPYPDMEIRFANPLGCHQAILLLSARRAREAVDKFQSVQDGRATVYDVAAVTPDETVLLLVGRGSRDDEATRDMHRFAELALSVPGPVTAGRAQVAFVAMARPSLDEALKEIEPRSFRHVIVQPHLLFGGRLLEGIRQWVTAIAENDSKRQWVVAEHLGPDDLVADAAIDRIDCADDNTSAILLIREPTAPSEPRVG